MVVTSLMRRGTATLICALAACGGPPGMDGEQGVDPHAADGGGAGVLSAAATAVALTWSVLDPGCGSITDSGLYTAPADPATCVVTVSAAGAQSTATAVVTAPGTPPSADQFGVRLLYPTAPGGRVWYLPDDADLNANAEFVPEAKDITVVQGGPATIYRTAGSGTANQVRLNVHSPAGAAWWRNVEVTAYYRYVSTSGQNYPHWEFAARTERHSRIAVTKGRVNDGVAPPAGTEVWPWWSAFANGDTLVPNALGTAYHGNLYVSHGTDPAWALFEKELSHTAGYAGQRGKVKTANPLPAVNQWFGAKFVVRNEAANTRVRLELWLDAAANGSWVQIGTYTDENGVGNDWVAPSLDGTDAAPYSIALNQLITWAGPWVCFRSDNVVMDFRKLSIREISPLP